MIVLSNFVTYITQLITVSRLCNKNAERISFIDKNDKKEALANFMAMG